MVSVGYVYDARLEVLGTKGILFDGGLADSSVVVCSASAGLVMINDVNEERLAVCRIEDPSFVTIGATNVKERVFELTRGKGADVVVSAASVPAVQQAAFGLAVHRAGLKTGFVFD